MLPSHTNHFTMRKKIQYSTNILSVYKIFPPKTATGNVHFRHFYDETHISCDYPDLLGTFICACEGESITMKRHFQQEAAPVILEEKTNIYIHIYIYTPLQGKLMSPPSSVCAREILTRHGGICTIRTMYSPSKISFCIVSQDLTQKAIKSNL